MCRGGGPGSGSSFNSRGTFISGCFLLLQILGGVGTKHFEALIVTQMLDVTVAHYVILAFGHLLARRGFKGQYKG